jgi:glycosyltransferase involved in cell wall biosynthesis
MILGFKIPHRVIFQNNSGQSVARNVGLSEVHCKNVVFLDQDDMWAPNHISTISLLLNENTACAYSAVKHVDEKGLVISVDTYNRDTFQNGISQALSGNIMIWPSSCIFKTHSIKALNGFDSALRGYEDDDLHFRMFRNGFNYKFSHSPTCYITEHPSRSSKSETMLISSIKFYDKHRILAEKYDILNTYNKRFFRACLKSFELELSDVNSELLRKSIKEMVRTQRRLIKGVLWIFLHSPQPLQLKALKLRKIKLINRFF